MPIRLPVAKLAASPVAPLQTRSLRPSSELLRSKNRMWVQDLGYLREIYLEIWAVWEAVQPFVYEEDAEGNRMVSEVQYDPEQDKQLFEKTEPLLRELLLGMQGVSEQRTSRPDILRTTEYAKHDFETAGSHARAGDYAMATVYQSYSLMKLHQLLDGMTREISGQSRKLGWGYDISGEQMEGGGTSGDDRHLWDTGNSPKRNRTPKNPANMLIDAEAETDFPELMKFKHKRVYWPPRTR